MLDDKAMRQQQLLAHVAKLGYSDEAYDFVRRTIEDGPSRKAGAIAKNNVSGKYFSASQSLTVQYESWTVELAWILRWEKDKRVLAYFDQPPNVELRKTDKNGRQYRSTYTADFLVIEKDRVYVVQSKDEKSLSGLAETNPVDWKLDDDNWVFVPATRKFDQIGLKHIVCNASALSKVETSNLKTLVSAGSEYECGDDSELRRWVDRLLSENAWLTLSDLRLRLGLTSYAPIFKLIDDGAIAANLSYHLLTHADAVLLSKSQDILQEVRRSGIDNYGDSHISVGVDRVPTRKQAARALKNLKRVQNENGRHVRRLKERIEEGAKRGLTPFQALLWRYKGNTSKRLDSSVEAFLTEHISTYHRAPGKKSANLSYKDYRPRARLAHKGFEPVTKKTYNRYVLKIEAAKIAESQGGRRPKNSAESATDVTDREISAVRAFERGCIDHALLKILVKVVESNGRIYCRRPWFTAIVDDYSGKWLSFHLSFNSPSRKALAVSIRNCVREYGRVPEFMHSDRGAEFKSVYYEELMAYLGVTLDWSPPAHSRFNSQVERLNLQLTQQWLAHRPGNVIDYDHHRKFSKGYRPQDLAVISMAELVREIEEFRQIYNDTIVGVDRKSPDTLFNESLQEFEFSGRVVEFNQEFVIATAVDTRHPEYAISPSGDIFRNGLHYFHSDLRRIRPKKSKTEVREDPEDPYRIFCKVGDKWITALNGRHNVFKSQSILERREESIIVSESRLVRDYAKEYAGELAAETRYSLSDQRANSTTNSNSTATRGQQPSPAKNKERSLFSKLRESEVSTLETEERI